MKVFVTKYALTAGIQEVEATEASIPGMISVAPVSKGAFGYNLHKGEWFPTREEAVEDAEKRRNAKIASLKKSLSKLERLSFR